MTVGAAAPTFFRGKIMSPHAHIRSLPPKGAHAPLWAALLEA